MYLDSILFCENWSMEDHYMFPKEARTLAGENVRKIKEEKRRASHILTRSKCARFLNYLNDLEKYFSFSTFSMFFIAIFTDMIVQLSET